MREREREKTYREKAKVREKLILERDRMRERGQGEKEIRKGEIVPSNRERTGRGAAAPSPGRDLTKPGRGQPWLHGQGRQGAPGAMSALSGRWWWCAVMPRWRRRIFEGERGVRDRFFDEIEEENGEIGGDGKVEGRWKLLWWRG